MTSTARVLLGFAVLGTSFLSGSFQHVGAQSAEAHSTSEQDLQAPSPEPAPEEPALQLVALDSTGVVFTLIPSPTADGYTLEEIETRVKRAKIGLGVSVVVMVGGGVLFLYGAAADDTAAVATGLILSLGGTGGTIASGILLRRRKRDRDSLRAAHYGTPRRVQWDLAQSRLVF